MPTCPSTLPFIANGVGSVTETLAFVLLLCCITSAQPVLSVTNLGTNADGNLQWRVDVEPDASLFSNGDGSLAAEIGFEVAGSIFVGATINDSVWAFSNPGFNPFTDSVTSGLTLGDAETFAAFGSDPVSGTVELLTLTTQGASETTLQWGGYSIRPGQPGSFDGARLAQAGINFDGISGSLGSGAVLVGDCNGDGVIDSADLDCACGAGEIGDVLASTGLLPGDLDGNGTVAFADFLTISANFGLADVGYTGGDINCDGEVAFADFLLLSGNFGNSSGGMLASVPEPASHFLLPTLAVLALVRRKRC